MKYTAYISNLQAILTVAGKFPGIIELVVVYLLFAVTQIVLYFNNLILSAEQKLVDLVTTFPFLNSITEETHLPETKRHFTIFAFYSCL
jgi:hypothetical protein